MKVISFSLWGDRPALVAGALANARLAREHYPGWSCRIYACNDVPERDIQALRSAGFKVFTCERPSPESWAGLFWRFEPASDPAVDVFISRDLDSRLNPREAAAVQDWLSSDFEFHSMRDHYQHTVPILGGMWGCRRNAWFGKQLDAWTTRSEKGSDQDFLAQKIWPEVRQRCLVHDRYTVDTPMFVDGLSWAYKPREFFGEQNLRAFPAHAPLDPTLHGEHVGARVGL